MVRLSPKALRFAEDAAHEVMDGARPNAVWESWSAARASRSEHSERTSAGGYEDVPQAVAAILFSAVEQRIGRMEELFRHNAEVDPDLGNDIAFLRTVSGTLRAGLEHMAEASS